MYANAPHASTAPSPVGTHPHLPQHQHGQAQDHAQAQAHVQQQAVASHYPQHAPHATMHYAAPSAPLPQPVNMPRRAPLDSTQLTGAYSPTGEPFIDRMRRLEAACLRFSR